MTTKFLSGKAPPEANSESQSRPNIRLIIYMVAGLALAAIAINLFMNTVGSPDVEPSQNSVFVQSVQPTVISASLVVTVVVTATPVPTLEPTPTPYIVYLAHPVTVTVPYTVEVIRNTVSYLPAPTPQTITQVVVLTPTTVPPGSLSICLYVEGVKSLFINEVGHVGNSCTFYTLNSPVNDFRIVVNK